MTQACRQPPADFHRYSLELHGAPAARHLFRVAAGLESMMLGESEIVGQIRDALVLAEAAGSAGPLLTGLFRSALRFGRRARAETRIGVGAMSVASASVNALRRTCADLAAAKIVVLGAGHTGVKAARHLSAERAGRIVLVNRTAERAREAASRLGVESAPLEELESLIATADALVTAVQAPEPLVDARLVRRALDGRSRPLTIVDLSLPRAVAADVEGLPAVTVVDLSRLEEAVAQSRSRRELEIPRVTELLGKAFEEFEAEAVETTARPLVAELRVRAEAIRRAEVERAVAAGLGDPAALDHVTRRVVDRLLHAPTSALRRGPSLAHRAQPTCLECVFGVGGRGLDAGD
jgi:glutamyl-tRNA reductase